MRKMNRPTAYGLVFFAAMLQVFIGNMISIGTVRPSLLIITTAFIALFSGRRLGIEIGFTAGLIMDVLSVRLFGLNIILFSLAGYIIGKISGKIYRESIITHAIIIFLSSLSMLVIYRLFLDMRHIPLDMGITITEILLGAVLPSFYNAVLGILAYTFLCRVLSLGEDIVL